MLNIRMFEGRMGANSIKSLSFSSFKELFGELRLNCCRHGQDKSASLSKSRVWRLMSNPSDTRFGQDVEIGGKLEGNNLPGIMTRSVKFAPANVIIEE